MKIIKKTNKVKKQNYKPITLNNKHSLPQFKQRLSKVTEPLERNRLKVLIEIKGGKNKAEVAKIFKMERGTVVDWVKAYNSKGFKGLVTNKGGRSEGNPTWDNKIFEKLSKQIDKQDQYWSIPLMMDWIKKKFHKEIPEQTVWYRMYRMNDFTYKSSRPTPYLGNDKKQKQFKKKDYPVY